MSSTVLDHQALGRSRVATQYTESQKFLAYVRALLDSSAELEAVLQDGETISKFVEAAVRNAVAFRQVSRFHKRGETAWERFQPTAESRSTEDVLSQLQMKLDAKRRQLAG